MQPNTPVPPTQRDPARDLSVDHSEQARDAHVAADQMHLATAALRAMFPKARGGLVRDQSDAVDV